MKTMTVGVSGRDVRVRLCEALTHRGDIDYATTLVSGWALVPFDACDACAARIREQARRAPVRVVFHKLPAPFGAEAASA